MALSDDNKSIGRRFLKLVEEGDVEGICNLVTPDWVMRGGPPQLPPGPEGVRKLFGSFGHIEQSWTVEDVISEGDKVVVRATCNVVQDSFFGIPGQGKTQVFTATFIHQVENGQIRNTWRNADDLGRVLQLGARIEPPSDTKDNAKGLV